MSVRFEFKPQDFWIGVFWRFGESYARGMQDQYGRLGSHVLADRDVWITLVPMFPLHISWFDHRCCSLELSALTSGL